MKKLIVALLLTALFSTSFVACQSADDVGTSSESAGGTAKVASDFESQNEDVSGYNTDNPDPKAPVISGLTYESTLQLDYAQNFAVYHYQDGYAVIRVSDERDYILIPDGKDVPDSLPSSCTIIDKPAENIYLAATATMSLFDSIDGVSNIRMSSIKENDWYIDNAKKAMADGDIIFAGKYSEPDYETILAEGCSVAVESTMIYHKPKVLEKLEELGIPVFVDRSSYESHPLGRTEWIKVYGEMIGKQDEAKAYFDEQKSYIESLKDEKNTGKTVVFFYVNQNGTVVTRKSSDYVAKMIELAGGEYAFSTKDIEEDNASSSVDMSMEDFYVSAIDADYLIYNGTIDTPIESVDELIAKSELFKDFKAVKEGNVWSAGKYLYQASHVIGSMTNDIHTMLTDENATDLTFMKRLK